MYGLIRRFTGALTSIGEIVVSPLGNNDVNTPTSDDLYRASSSSSSEEETSGGGTIESSESRDYQPMRNLSRAQRIYGNDETDSDDDDEDELTKIVNKISNVYQVRHCTRPLTNIHQLCYNAVIRSLSGVQTSKIYEECIYKGLEHLHSTQNNAAAKHLTVPKTASYPFLCYETEMKRLGDATLPLIATRVNTDAYLVSRKLDFVLSRIIESAVLEALQYYTGRNEIIDLLRRSSVAQFGVKCMTINPCDERHQKCADGKYCPREVVLYTKRNSTFYNNCVKKLTDADTSVIDYRLPCAELYTTRVSFYLVNFLCGHLGEFRDENGVSSNECDTLNDQVQTTTSTSTQRSNHAAEGGDSFVQINMSEHAVSPSASAPTLTYKDTNQWICVPHWFTALASETANNET